MDKLTIISGTLFFAADVFAIISLAMPDWIVTDIGGWFCSLICYSGVLPQFSFISYFAFYHIYGAGFVNLAYYRCLYAGYNSWLGLYIQI
jgi:hypothetical protein